jgi:hypothetical protein
MGCRAVFAVTLLVATIAACGPSLAHVAKERGAVDLDCPVQLVDAYRAEGGVYVAHGCERWIQYTCVYSGDRPVCMREAEPKPKPEPGS